MSERLLAAIGNLAAVPFTELGDRSNLLTRYDRKYAVSMRGAIDLVDALAPDWLVVVVDGERSPSYHTTYFDDFGRTSLHDHLKERRRRHKVRVRTYANGATFLEVKTKDGRGQTDKRRVERTSSSTVLGSSELDWLSEQLPDVDVRALRPELVVEYQRITLLGPTGDERLTIDHMLRVGRGDSRHPLLDEGALVEVKSTRPHSSVSRTLWRVGGRSVSFSKYCAGVSVVDPTIHPRSRTLADRVVARG